MKVAKKTRIQGQCQEVEACLRKNNSKKAHQLVKDLTTEKQSKSTTIQDCPQIPDEEHHLILWEDVEAAVKALKMEKSAGVDNI